MLSITRVTSKLDNLVLQNPSIYNFKTKYFFIQIFLSNQTDKIYVTFSYLDSLFYYCISIICISIMIITKTQFVVFSELYIFDRQNICIKSEDIQRRRKG